MVGDSDVAAGLTRNRRLPGGLAGYSASSCAPTNAAGPGLASTSSARSSSPHSEQTSFGVVSASQARCRSRSGAPSSPPGARRPSARAPGSPGRAPWREEVHLGTHPVCLQVALAGDVWIFESPELAGRRVSCRLGCSGMASSSADRRWAGEPEFPRKKARNQ
jgi:hypothetical protein